jgi:aspartate-semialdehyde dehydrogenase
MKMVNETKKIMGDDSIRVTATTVRVTGHGLAIQRVSMSSLKRILISMKCGAYLAQAPGVIVTDDVANLQYPMPLTAHDRDEVFVGRLRRDETQPNTLNMRSSPTTFAKVLPPMRCK